MGENPSFIPDRSGAAHKKFRGSARHGRAGLANSYLRRAATCAMAAYTVTRPRRAESDPFPAGEGRTVDLRAPLGLSEMRARMWYFDPGESSFYHRHEQQEELYYLLDGPAQIRVGAGEDETVLDVEEGSAVRVAPGAARQLRNDTDSPTRWLVIAAPNVREVELYDDDRGEFVPLDEFR